MCTNVFRPGYPKSIPKHVLHIERSALQIGRNALRIGRNVFHIGRNALLIGRNAFRIGRNGLRANYFFALGEMLFALGEMLYELGEMLFAFCAKTIQIGRHVPLTERNSVQLRRSVFAFERNPFSMIEETCIDISPNVLKVMLSLCRLVLLRLLLRELSLVLLRTQRTLSRTCTISLASAGLCFCSQWCSTDTFIKVVIT